MVRIKLTNEEMKELLEAERTRTKLRGITLEIDYKNPKYHNCGKLEFLSDEQFGDGVELPYSQYLVHVVTENKITDGRKHEFDVGDCYCFRCNSLVDEGDLVRFKQKI